MRARPLLFAVIAAVVGACSAIDFSQFRRPSALDAGGQDADLSAAPPGTTADAGMDSAPAALPLGCDAGIAAGLVGYWRMEEGQGTDVGDCSGNAFDGAIQGDVVWETGRGPSSQALHFNGGYVSLPPRAIADVTSSFSVVAWVSFDNGINSGLISRGDQANDRGWSIEMETDRTLSFYLSADSTSFVGAKTVAVQADTWFHFAAVFDAGKTQSIYVNGKKLAGIDAPPRVAATSKRPLEIGRGWASCCSLAGKIDELRFYARALSPEEVGTLSAE